MTASSSSTPGATLPLTGRRRPRCVVVTEVETLRVRTGKPGRSNGRAGEAVELNNDHCCDGRVGSWHLTVFQYHTSVRPEPNVPNWVASLQIAKLTENASFQGAFPFGLSQPAFLAFSSIEKRPVSGGCCNRELYEVTSEIYLLDSS